MKKKAAIHILIFLLMESSLHGKEPNIVSRSVDVDGDGVFTVYDLMHQGESDRAEELDTKAAAGDAKAQFAFGRKHELGKDVEQNYKEAVRWYRKAAEQHLAAAQLGLGLMYEGGKGVERDYKEAIRWYRKAAEQGLILAQSRLGFMYDSGIGVEKNHEEAVRWYRKAAEQGDSLTQWMLGLAHYMGRGVDQDRKEAVRWYREAAEQGLAAAQFNLASMYGAGEGVDQDLDESVRWYRKAAEQGHAGAQLQMGLAYKYGICVDQDLKKAVRWYREAAEQGDASAQLNLGQMYRDGQGVEKDCDQAFRWILKAAEQGDLSAQFMLGVMHNDGQGGDQVGTGSGGWYRRQQAISWWRKSAEQGLAEAQFHLAIAYGSGRGVHKDNKEVVRWLRKAAAQGHAGAQTNLGYAYDNGEGVYKDHKEAVRWYRKAAEQGDAVAQKNLASAYYSGQGVIEDYGEAYKWVLLAAREGKDVASLKNKLKAQMTMGQIAQAQKRARVFVAREEEPTDNSKTVNESEAVTPKSTGTGFFIASRGYLVTAAHVVADPQSLKVYARGRQYEANVALTDEAADVAVLKVTGSGFAALPLIPSSATKLGDKVFTVGFPNIDLQGAEAKYTEGTISSLSGPANNPRYFQISTPVQPGNSGGPLVNTDGQVVGIVTARLSDVGTLIATGTMPQNVNYAMKSSFVLPFVESVPGLAAEMKKAKAGGKDSSVIIENAKAAVVLVMCY